jgi:hypothetical protein
MYIYEDSIMKPTSEKGGGRREGSKEYKGGGELVQRMQYAHIDFSHEILLYY